MRTGLIILGILFILGCILDYCQFRDELIDMHKAADEAEAKTEAEDGNDHI